MYDEVLSKIIKDETERLGRQMAEALRKVVPVADFAASYGQITERIAELVSNWRSAFLNSLAAARLRRVHGDDMFTVYYRETRPGDSTTGQRLLLSVTGYSLFIFVDRVGGVRIERREDLITKLPLEFLHALCQHLTNIDDCGSFLIADFNSRLTDSRTQDRPS